MRRRMICLFTVFFLFLTALTIRLAYIQFIDGSKYRNIISGQSKSSIDGIWVRGTIYDRNSIPLTNGEDNFYYILREDKIDHGAESILMEMNARLIEGTDDKYRVYSIDTIDSAGSRKLCRDYGSLAVKAWRRYSNNQPAMHMIGYLDPADHSGCCGIEKDFEGVLSSGKRSFTYQNDGRGYYISGKGVQMDGDGREWGVFTTLNIGIQKAAEKALEDIEGKGAVIVTHIQDGDVLASASAPGYDPYSISDLDGDSGILLNRATGSLYPTGALYDVIAEVAANESGINEGNLIDNMAGLIDALGFNSEPIGLLSGQIVGEHSGTIKDLLISPMQAARMTRIIALEGRDGGLRLIRGTIEGVRGASLLPKTIEKQVIPADVAKALGRMMQKQRLVEGGEEEDDICFGTENCDGGYWLSGYLPFDDPMYGITVYVEEQEDDAMASAKSVYNDIARFITGRSDQRQSDQQ